MSYMEATFTEESTFEYLSEEDEARVSGAGIWAAIPTIAWVIGAAVHHCRGGRRNPKKGWCLSGGDSSPHEIWIDT